MNRTIHHPAHFWLPAKRWPGSLASIGILSLALCCTMGSQPAQAQRMANTPIQLDVVDRQTGRVLPVYSHRGEWWIEGRPGASYGLRITNRSPSRVLAVMSVDGVNILTGETASPDQGGYVLEPRQSSQINGWRKSSTEVAGFYFTSLPNSYAARTGRPNDIGVIGVAVFEEYRRPPPPPIYRDPYLGRKRAAEESEAMAADAPMAEKSARANAPSMGTGHGRREYDYSQTTEFERASRSPVTVMTLRYDSRENLVARGILAPGRPHWQRGEPNAFPGESSGYVPDPPWN